VFGSPLALEIVDPVSAPEEGAEAAAFGAALPEADLVGVRVDDDVGAAAACDGQEGCGLVGLVVDLVRALFADGKVEYLALFELTGSLRRAQGGAAGEDDYELLVGVVEVVRVGGLAWWQLPLAAADQLGPELVADAGALGAEPLRALALLENWAVDVWHGETLAAWPTFDTAECVESRMRFVARGGRRYLTVSVPSMPASRWPGTEQ